MYSHHPLDVEEFDYDTFETENFETLRSFLREISDRVPGPASDRSVIEERACMLTIGVFHDLETFGDEPVLVEEGFEDDPAVKNFFDAAVVTCFYIHLMDTGVLEHNPDGGWRMTNFGKQQYSRIVKRRGASEAIQKALKGLK